MPLRWSHQNVCLVRAWCKCSLLLLSDVYRVMSVVSRWLACLRLGHQLRLASHWEPESNLDVEASNVQYLHHLIRDQSGGTAAQEAIEAKIRSEIRKCLEVDRRAAAFGRRSDGGSILHRPDEEGATVLHKLVLHGRYSIAMELVEQRPELALQGYQSEEYEGENILHMIIAAREHGVAVQLLDLFWPSIHDGPRLPKRLAMYNDLLDKQATGRFFRCAFRPACPAPAHVQPHLRDLMPECTLKALVAHFCIVASSPVMGIIDVYLTWGGRVGWWAPDRQK